MCLSLSVNAFYAFVRVAYINNPGYIGALFGLVAALIYMVRVKRIERHELMTADGKIRFSTVYSPPGTDISS